MFILRKAQFADLSDQQRAGVLAWAQSHDWGTEAYWADCSGQLLVYGFNDVLQADSWLHFETLGALRDWAGY